MNPHFRELAQQAGLGTRWTSTQEFEQFLERFAELTVQECAKVVDGQAQPVYDGNLLKQHFGF